MINREAIFNELQTKNSGGHFDSGIINFAIQIDDCKFGLFPEVAFHHYVDRLTRFISFIISEYEWDNEDSSSLGMNECGD